VNNQNAAKLLAPDSWLLNSWPISMSRLKCIPVQAISLGRCTPKGPGEKHQNHRRIR